MSSKIFEFVLEAILVFALVMTPLAMIWGWLKWARSEKQRTFSATASLMGFSAATLSVLLAVFLCIYGHAIGGFQFYDHRLMKIYAWGLLLSATSVILALAGIWRRNQLRWQALICGVGTLSYWFMLAESE